MRHHLVGVGAVIHAATLHKPHVATHSNQDFIDTNITATLVLLEEAASARVTSFVFTSTTSAFGSALTPAAVSPAAWVTEDVQPIAKNIYGVAKLAAETLCEMFSRRPGSPRSFLERRGFFLKPMMTPIFVGNTGKTPGSRLSQAGCPRQRTRSGRSGTTSRPGTLRRLPR
jgi:UDP-glucose 4-epimerase